VYNCARFCAAPARKWSEWQDLNLRPPRPEHSDLRYLADLYSATIRKWRERRENVAGKLCRSCANEGAS
jgi:hypothetical protein